MITCAVLQVSMARQSERQRFGMQRAAPGCIAIDTPIHPSPMRNVRLRRVIARSVIRQQARRDRFG